MRPPRDAAAAQKKACPDRSSIMNGKGRRSSFEALRLNLVGSLRGEGELSAGKSHGWAQYEIDGYRERTKVVANGRLFGGRALIAAVFAAGGGRLALADGSTIDFVLKPDPDGEENCEIELTGVLPSFAMA